MNREEKHMEEEMTSSSLDGGAEEKSTGAIIGAIIIVVLLVIGGIYFLGQRVSVETLEDILGTPDTSTEMLEAQGASDELSSIEMDAEATDFSDLDMEMSDIEKELAF